MKAYKNLANNIVVFTLGSLISRVISFLLIPLYTHYLSTSEFGHVDIINTTSQLLLPIVSLCMYDAVLRFSIDQKDINDGPKDILYNGLFISIVSFLFFILLFPLLNRIEIFQGNTIYLYLILFSTMTNQIFGQFSRGVGKVEPFAISGIITAFILGISNIILIVYFDLGIYGYFISMILANFLSALYLLISLREYLSMEFTFDKQLSNAMLSYSLPLIPNYVMWWIANGSSKYFISYMIGPHANGIFAVSSRIPSLINLATTVFSQAWQLTAVEEFDNDNSKKVFSDIFSFYNTFLVLVVSIILIFLKLLIRILASEEFYSSWEPVPFLIIGAVFSALFGFIGQFYVANKKTTGLMRTSVIGGILSLIVNYIGIKNWGVVGAGIASAISFGLLFLYRYYDLKQLNRLDIDWLRFLLSYLGLIVQSLLLFLIKSSLLHYVFQLICFFFLLVVNSKDVVSIISVLNKALKNVIK